MSETQKWNERDVCSRSEHGQAIELAESAASRAHRRMKPRACGADIDRGPNFSAPVKMIAKVLGGLSAAAMALGLFFESFPLN